MFVPALFRNSSWISGSGSERESRTSMLDLHELRHRQAEQPSELARDELGDERLGALRGAAELRHVRAVVVGLDDRGYRAALAERRQVARRTDGSHIARLPHRSVARGFMARRRRMAIAPSMVIAPANTPPTPATATASHEIDCVYVVE